ncbi:uncharacterized protein fam83ha [Epinephelus lanceolatus]
MARRSQCSSAGDNPLDPNYLPPHYREEYRLAIDALIEEDLEGYYQFLQKADVVDFLSTPEIHYIQSSVQVPQQSNYPEQHFLEIGGDGSSDTYWPIHSDLEAPGLDLGWPQLHPFLGPTEVTTLVNPPEPDMPSIKEQARRLIKNARQVVAIVMDMFTDVDMFADILDAAMRNVAVYIILDEQNAHHFVHMVSNCRVNLHNIQLLRVRTVSGITYHCRSGKSFKGQMMDRFLLTDCRAVLSGNYSFMWSFEKLHRCMAHLFLGQLVTTFDEEFRILYAQSEPLVIENVNPMEEFSLVQKRQYPSERTMYREPKKFQSLDTAHPEEWLRHSYDERMDIDRRMMPLKKQESLHGPAEMYGRFPSQQSRMDPSFDQGPSRMPLMENLAFKRHSYAEGAHGRFSYPFLQQQGMPEPENQGRQFHRGQQPYLGPGKEADYSTYDKFWNQDFQSADQYSEPGFPQEIEPPDNFDPVLNYLSSTRLADFDQGSERLPPGADLPFGSSHHRRLSLGKLRASQVSPTPSNPDQKPLIQEPNTDRKDPMVKRGLRNWRISSYLSTYDNTGDEGLPSTPPNAPDPFEETTNVIQQTPGTDLQVPKIPNVREFKVPAIPRVSQVPSYAKTTAREQPKKLLDEPTAAAAAETKTTPTPSESSSTTETDKMEEAEQKEPKTVGLRREESFRRKYNAAIPRSSRLRSSLIFSSMEQQNTSQDTKTAPGQQDEETDKNEAEQTKLPFVSQVLGQRRATAREPFEWTRYIKSATFDSSSTDPSKQDDGNRKADDKDSPKEENSKTLSEVQEPPDVEQTNSSPSVPQSKASEAKLPKTDQPLQSSKSFLATPSHVDMNDPDKRLMFFKELAAKRKAAKAAELEKSKDNASLKPTTELKNNTTVIKKEPVPKETAEKKTDTSTSESLLEKNAAAEDAGKTEACKSVSLSLDVSDKSGQDSQVMTDPKSFKQEQTSVSTDLEGTKLKKSQSAVTLPVLAEKEAPQSKPPAERKLSNPAVKTRSPSQPPTPTNATPASVSSLAKGTNGSESPRLDSTSKESSSLIPSLVEVSPSSTSAALNSNIPNPKSVQSETSTSTSPLLPKQQAGTELSSSKPLGQSSSSDHILPDSGSQISPSPAPTSAETTPSKVTQADSSSTLTSSKGSPKTKQSVSSSVQEPSQMTSSETPSGDDSAHLESNISADTCAAGSEKNLSSLESTSKTDSKEHCAPTPSEEDVPASENITLRKAVEEESEHSGSSKDVKADSTPPSLSTSLPESNLSDVSDLERKSKSDRNEAVSPTPSAADTPPKQSAAELSSPVHPDLTPNVSQAKATASPQDAPIQATPPSELNLKGSVTPTPAGTVSCSPLTVSVGSVLSPEGEKTLSALHSPQDTNALPKQIPKDSNETPLLPSAESSSSAEPTSKVPKEADLPCKTPESVISKTHPSEPLVPAKTVSCSSPLTESVGSALSPEAEKSSSALPSPPDTKSPPKQVATDLNKTPKLPSTERSSPTEPTSKVPKEVDLSCKTPESVTPETHPSKPLLPAETVSCSPPTESVGSVLSLEAEKSSPESHSPPDTSCLPKQIATDLNKTPKLPSTETSSPSEPTSKVPSQPNLPCKTPESVTPETQPSESQVTAENSNMDSQNKVSKEPEKPDLGKKETADTTKEVNKETDLQLVKKETADTKTTNDFNKETDLQLVKKETADTTTTNDFDKETELQPVTKETTDTTTTNDFDKETELQPVKEKTVDTKDRNEVNKATTQGSVCIEKTNDQVKQNNCSESPEVTSDKVSPQSPQSKQPKSSQSRYQSSTANVLSSSNLRDDTKLLLEQISANSQNRNEAAKDSPVTDDEKEDKADKKQEKEKGISSLTRGQPKISEDREKLLERIQSMRKERKVYSRFEMAP